MLCELCGKEVTFCKKVTIESVQLEVCAECAKFGIEAKKAPPKEEGPKPIIEQRLEFREKRSRPKDILEASERDELVEDYSARIRNARSQKGMTQKDLAMKINERLTLLSKIETGDMRPDDKIVAKLEKELGIKLKEKVVDAQVTKGTGTSSLTLADLIRMQKD
jgi:putative transcription factor